MTNYLKDIDPFKRQADVSSKERGSEFSPMNPPDAYNPPSDVMVEYKELHPLLKRLVDEHTEIKTVLDEYEIILKNIRKNRQITDGIKNIFPNLLHNLKLDFATHNKQEEKFLFPLLEKRFLEVGEHSKSRNPITPVGVLEDEHDEASTLIDEINYIWCLIGKIVDPNVMTILIKDFYLKSQKLIEHMRLHIFREDKIVFSLAQRHLSTEELDMILSNF